MADDINGSTVSGGRASMLFKPSETFSLQLTAYHPGHRQRCLERRRFGFHDRQRRCMAA